MVNVPGGTVKLRVGRQQERLLASGHPWLFAKGIVSQSGEGPPGILGVVFDRRDRFLAVGLYDPGSPIRLRVLQVRKPTQIDAQWWRGRVVEAVRRRASIAASGTTGYRVIHGESDGIPALVADRYARSLVLKVYSAALFPHLPAILQALIDELCPEHVILRLSRLLQTKAETLGGHHEGQLLLGTSREGTVRFQECGLLFEADLLLGQKTGFFLDQRENRARVGQLAGGRTILNAFSYSGGFSVHAAAGGATSVVSLDSSKQALASARRNFALNPRLDSVPHETIAADAFESIATLHGERRSFDLVITDPPSFARKKEQREVALRAYRKLARLAAAVVAPGGILVSCSCSSQVSAAVFESAVEAGLAGGRWRLLERRGHALDHPIGFPEASYLKSVYFQRV